MMIFGLAHLIYYPVAFMYTRRPIVTERGRDIKTWYTATRCDHMAFSVQGLGSLGRP